MLNNLTGTPQYQSWLAHTLRPHLGDAVLEVGAGIGDVTSRLMARRLLCMAAEKDPLCLHALRNRFLRTPNVEVQGIDPETPKDFAGLENCIDTVLCVNLLEYVDNPKSVLERLCTTLKPAGIVLISGPPEFAALRFSRSPHRAQAALQQSGNPGNAPLARARSGEDFRFQQSRNSPVVGLPQTLRRTEDQQTIVEDFPKLSGHGAGSIRSCRGQGFPSSW